MGVSIDTEEADELMAKIVDLLIASPSRLTADDVLANYEGVHDPRLVRRCVWALIDGGAVDYDPDDDYRLALT